MNYDCFTNEEIIQAKTNPALQDRIIKNYRRVAYKYAYKNIKRTWNPNWSLEDYYAVGLYGIYYAIQYYDPKHQCTPGYRTFTSLVFLCVKHQCAALRNTFHFGRLSLSPDARKALITNVIYLDDKSPEAEEYQGTYGDMLLDTQSDFSADLIEKELTCEFWQQVKDALPLVEYDLIYKHFKEDKSYRKIEQETGMRYATVRRYVLKGIETLKRHPHFLAYANAL